MYEIVMKSIFFKLKTNILPHLPIFLGFSLHEFFPIYYHFLTCLCDIETCQLYLHPLKPRITYSLIYKIIRGMYFKGMYLEQMYSESPLKV